MKAEPAITTPKQDLDNASRPIDRSDTSEYSTSHSGSILTTQVGGNHYKVLPIQPIEFILKNKLGFCEGNVIKYICRFRLKGGTEDLEKARHYIDVLIENQKKGIS